MPCQWLHTGMAWPAICQNAEHNINLHHHKNLRSHKIYRFHANIIYLWFLDTLARHGKLPCVGIRRLIPRVTRPLVAACPISCTTWWWDVLRTDWEFTYTISSPVHSLPSRSAAPPATMCPIDTWEQVMHCIIFRDRKNTYRAALMKA